jgi:hypothetical protein
MIRLDKNELENKLYLFCHLIREDIFENEICYSCLKAESSEDNDLCKCNKDADFVIADFKLYEKFFEGSVITEIKYYYDPYTRYIYCLNQKDEILKVFEIDNLENKIFKDFNGFEVCLNYHITNDIILCYLYYHFKKENESLSYLFNENFDELIREKLIEFLISSDYETRIQSISILYPWINTIKDLENLIDDNSEIQVILYDFREFIKKLGF